MSRHSMLRPGARALLIGALASALAACASGRRCGCPCPSPCPPPCCPPVSAPPCGPAPSAPGPAVVVRRVEGGNVVLLTDVTTGAAPANGTITFTVTAASAEPTDPLERLMAGNARYVAGKAIHPDAGLGRRAELAKSQAPFAIILGCSDSRVGPELVFDQGLGDLFVARVAGNVVDPIVLGSIEYAAEHLHSTLIVVLGHERCGAVTAALGGGEAPGNIKALVEAIAPAVAASAEQPGDKLDNAIAENVRMQVANMRAKSAILDHLIADGKLKVVGARYDLDTGQVELVT